jgi:O-antigen/teichoic acid export membrane protein
VKRPSGLRVRSIWHRLRGIITDTGWTGAKEVVTLVTGLVVLQVLIVGLGPAAYGRYAAVSVLAGILTMLSSSWVQMLLLQRTLRNARPLDEAFARSLGMALPATAVAFALGCVLGALLIPGLAFSTIALFIAAELLGGLLLQLSAAAVQSARGVPAATRVRMLLVLTRFFVVVGVGLSGRADLPLLAVSLFVGYGLVGIVVFWWTTRTLSLPRLPTRFPAHDLREGLSYAGTLAALAIQEDSDKVFLVRLVDPVSAGLYAAAYRIVQLGFIPIRALQASSHPRFLVNTAGARNEHLSRAVRYTLPTAGYGVAAVVGIVMIAPHVPLLFGTEYEGTSSLMIGLAPLVLLRSLSLFPVNSLLGLERHRLRFLTMLACTVLNLVLNAALIPHHSVWGAVAATLVTEVVFVLAAWGALSVAQRRHDQHTPPVSVASTADAPVA